MAKKILLYVIVLTIPLSLGLVAWQSAQYSALKKDVERLNTVQDELIMGNKRLITEIASLSSPARIEKIAKNDLGFGKKAPEEVLQITIEK
jgi:cell division protein FtsL